MDRKEIIDYIKSNNLQEDVKKTCGKNYTILPTSVLESFVSVHQESKKVVKSAVKSSPAKTVSNINPLSRQECFEAIKKNNWCNLIKETYGKPYNSVSTDLLNQFVNKFNNKENQCNQQKVATTPSCVDVEARKAIKTLCALINAKHIAENL